MARPDVRGVFGATLSLWREMFWLTAVLGLLGNVPEAVTNLIGDDDFLLQISVSLVVSSAFEALILSLVAEKIFAGQFRVNPAVDRAKRYFIQLLLVNAAMSVLAMLGLAACLVGTVFVAAWGMQAVPIALFEGQSVHRALAESFRRARPHTWRLAAVSLVVMVITFFPSIAAQAWEWSTEDVRAGAEPGARIFAVTYAIRFGATLVEGVLGVCPQLFQLVLWCRLKPPPPVSVSAPVPAPELVS